jgi:predicted signal transduction protein with EAL and GGDEF domain
MLRQQFLDRADPQPEKFKYKPGRMNFLPGFVMAMAWEWKSLLLPYGDGYNFS